MTERLHFHFSLSCIGEGNGNPLQCSCLENPRDGGTWWAAIYGVAQSQTRLKWLSSSSSSRVGHNWSDLAASSERVTGSERAYVDRITKRAQMKSLSGGPVVKNLPANAEDMGLIPAPGRFHTPTCHNYCNPSTPESMLHKKRNQCNVRSVHCNQRVAPALGN